MSKYIPADKLIAEIERLEHENCMNGGEHFCMRRAICLGNLRNIIASPYHEQPERICPRCVYHNKAEDMCEYPYGGRNCYINENGVYECNGFEEIKQPRTCKTCSLFENHCPFVSGKFIPYPSKACKDYTEKEVKLEKEIENYFGDVVVMPNCSRMTLEKVARHFYELGLNAKKEVEP